MIIKARPEVGLSVILIIQASIMFVVAPLAASGLIVPAAIDVFRFALAASALLMVTRTRVTAALIAATFGATLILSFLLPWSAQFDAAYLSRLAATSAFDVAVAVIVGRVAFSPGRVSVHRIMGCVILYLSLGLIFANAYRVVAILLHPSFSGLPEDRRGALSQLLYFSLSTLTSNGYGDIVPLHPFARSLSNLEAVIGQLFPATLLARLVTLHAAQDGGVDG